MKFLYFFAYENCPPAFTSKNALIMEKNNNNKKINKKHTWAWNLPPIFHECIFFVFEYEINTVTKILSRILVLLLMEILVVIHCYYYFGVIENDVFDFCHGKKQTLPDNFFGNRILLQTQHDKKKKKASSIENWAFVDRFIRWLFWWLIISTQQ